MAIRIEAQLSKKIPIPGQEFSSQQASITISAEVTDPSQIVLESHRLYALAEQSVNQQLKITPAPSPQIQRSQPTQHRPAQASAPYRRGPAPITDSQLRFLNKLIQQGNHDVHGILSDFAVQDLRDIPCKDAVGLIDRLKAGVA